PLFASVEDKMVVTKGAEGVQFKTATGELRKIPAFSVDVVDTTGAGDTFNGVLATELGRTNDIDQAVKFANAAAALSIQKIGAQGGMAYRDEVEIGLDAHYSLGGIFMNKGLRIFHSDSVITALVALAIALFLDMLAVRVGISVAVIVSLEQ